MNEIQYIVSGVLSLWVSFYVLVKRPKTIALKSLVVFGLVITLWEVSTFFYRIASNVFAATSYFRILILTSHLGFPIYLFTILNIRERRNSKFLMFILLPAIIQVLLMTQNEYIANYVFFRNELGWVYKVESYQPQLIMVSIIFLGYLLGIVLALFFLIRNTEVHLLRTKYIILLTSFLAFQIGGTTLINALQATSFLSPVYQIGGIMQFLSFLAIWYALSLKKGILPSSSVKSKEFSEIYSSFLTVYYNFTANSRLGEEFFEFTNFLKDSKIEDKVSLKKGIVSFEESGLFDISTLIIRNLEFFKKHHIDDEVIDHYLRVLNIANQRWGISEIIMANLDFLERSDLIYGVSQGEYLENIDQDQSLDELEAIDTCLRIYKRILLPIAIKIREKPAILKEISEIDLVKTIQISDYGEISIKEVKKQTHKISKNLQISAVIERFNTSLSVIYEELMDSSDIDEILKKINLVLSLNKDKAISLGIYPSLLGTLATKVPKTQIHKLYSDYLEDLIEEKTGELREAQENLLKSQRLAAIGEAAAMVGHDLRNPLQAIVNTLYLAERKLESSPNEDLSEILETIGEQVEYMNKIVSDLQDYARPLNPKFGETTITELINDTLSLISIPGNIEIKTEIENDLDFPKLIVDSSYMKRVFSNLIMNAIQAMPDGGQLTIRVSQKRENVFIQFQDTGVGISEENMLKLFQPLFTTKAKGQGLGLPVCKRLVEAHKGTITAKSKLGIGTTFTIELPLVLKKDFDTTKLSSPIAAVRHDLRNPSRS